MPGSSAKGIGIEDKGQLNPQCKNSQTVCFWIPTHQILKHFLSQNMDQLCTPSSTG